MRGAPVSSPVSTSSRTPVCLCDPLPRQLRSPRFVYGCSAGRDGLKGVSISKARAGTVKSTAVHVPSAPSCPWPREESYFGGGGIGLALQPPNILGSLKHLWETLLREDDLPVGVEAMAKFSDGPGVGKPKSDAKGIARWWRHQGMKF